ncbi:retropepsin-like domain-containing protein [Butyricimonas paravirosa]|uniref:retropepsin-like domain-containing protein n=1 Tax=Butyricimonas paravirosa TaxID=1472417 RepID=UPI00210B4F72|nr:retropepsin-like domain-containing protein [Butyricimonas paravirosa]MCQ4873301.1 retropepsin-like domain-containing protein [Butyricimonas paravirosa]
MLNMKWKALLCAVFVFSLARGFAQQQTKRVCDTIRYEFIEDKIVIPVTVNGVVVKYIVDTGGQTGTDWEHAQKMGAVGTGASNPIADLNGKKQLYQIAEVKDVRLSPNYTLNSLKTMIFPVIGSFRSLGVVGILGGDAFAESVITFDAREKIMVINYPYRPDRLKVTDGVEMFGGDTRHSIIKMNLGGVEKEVLFDTGAGGFLLLNASDFKDIEEQGSGEKVARAFGINGIGLEGLSEPTEIDKVNVKEMTILGKKFSNVGSLTSELGSTIVGVELLEYGKVVIDYMRNRFYFFPFDTRDTDMGGVPKTWNVSILPANERFEITRIWDSMKDVVAFGDQVVDINGTDITGFPMSQPEIDRVMGAIEGDRAYIVVLKDGKRKKVEIKRE